MERKSLLFRKNYLKKIKYAKYRKICMNKMFLEFIFTYFLWSFTNIGPLMKYFFPKVYRPPNAISLFHVQTFVCVHLLVVKSYNLVYQILKACETSSCPSNSQVWTLFILSNVKLQVQVRSPFTDASSS